MERLIDAIFVFMGYGPIKVIFTAEDEAQARVIARRWAAHYLGNTTSKPGDMQTDLEIDIIFAIKEFAEADRYRREAQRLREQGAGKPNHEAGELQ